MKVKLLKKIRKDWHVKNDMLISKDFKNRYDLKFTNSITDFCVSYMYVGVNYWLNHNQKLTINRNKKIYNK